MANEEFTLAVFKRRLKSGAYKTIGSARIAIGRGQVMSKKEKESAERSALRKFSSGGPAPKKGKKVAKKVAKKIAKTKGNFGPGKGRKPKKATGSKSAFIMDQPLTMAPKDVVVAAAKAGLEVTAQYVSNLRSAAKRTGKKPAKSVTVGAGKKAKKKAAKKTAAKAAAPKRTPKQGAAPKRTPVSSSSPVEMTSAQIRKHPLMVTDLASRVIGSVSQAITAMKESKELFREVDIAKDVSAAASTIGRAVNILDHDVVRPLSVEGSKELKMEDLTPEERKAVEILQRTRPGIISRYPRGGNGVAKPVAAKKAAPPAEEQKQPQP